MPKDQDKPAPIALNLDTLERENAPEPFVVVLGGRRFTLRDAEDVDFRELLESQRAAKRGEPEKALEIVIEDVDREAFLGNKLPNWKLEKLFRSYNDHHGLPNPGEADALPTS